MSGFIGSIASPYYVKPFEGEAVYTTPGTYTFNVPANVTSISAFAVGAGGSGGTSGGGSGGGTAWMSGFAVSPGDAITVTVGALTGTGYSGLSNAAIGVIIRAFAGSSNVGAGSLSNGGSGALGTGVVGDISRGGRAGTGENGGVQQRSAGGGGAGGYTGSTTTQSGCGGGWGGDGASTAATVVGEAGLGGAGGGAGGDGTIIR